MGTKVTNYEKLKTITNSRKPLILFDVEATGIMNGNDNHITQIALTAYNYNGNNGRYELQDNLFMLAKAQPDSLYEIELRSRPNEENATRILKEQYVFGIKSEINRVLKNCSNRIDTLESNKIPNIEDQIRACSTRAVKRKESLETRLKDYQNNLKLERDFFARAEALLDSIRDVNPSDMTVTELDKKMNEVLTSDTWRQGIHTVITTDMYAGVPKFASNANTIYRDGKAYTVSAKELWIWNKKLYEDRKAQIEFDDFGFFTEEECDKSIRDCDTRIAMICESLPEYIKQGMEQTLTTLRESIDLDAVLKSQGIDKSKWVQDGLGLTVGEMQVGINEFLKKYQTPNTTFITNGTYYANHYLKKDGLVLPMENTIDMIQVEKSRNHGPKDNGFSANIADFAVMYEAETGKQIKTFDAYTKSLCYAEMVARATGITISNRSVNQLANAVTEKVALMDEDYVMSASRASSLHWNIATEYEFTHSDFKFDALEYVDFGNHRKYVDLDTMFEVNDNFEITLEGDKDPIKTWEELEAKIVALNSNISEELLLHIKEKYEELEASTLALKDEMDASRTNYSEVYEDTKPESPPEPRKSIYDAPEYKSNSYGGYIEEEDEIPSNSYDEVKDNNEALTMQNQLMEQIAQFDRDMQAKELEIEQAKTEIDKATEQKIAFIKNEIMALKPYVLAVSERVKKPELGSSYYNTTVALYFNSKNYGIDYQGEEPIVRLNADSLPSLDNTIIEYWDEFKQGLLERCQKLLNNSLQKKYDELDSQKRRLERIQRMDER